VHKDIRVLLVEDDCYARDLMALLLTRDWRTRVVAAVTDRQELSLYLAKHDAKVDVVVMDIEIPDEPELAFKLAEMTQSLALAPAILYTATKSSPQTAERLMASARGSYVLKGELFYGLASAIAMVVAGHRVITPGIERWVNSWEIRDSMYVFDGREMLARFTPREREMVRLGLIYNLSTRDIADELVLSAGWVSEIMSIIYQKLGMRDILSGYTPLENYFIDEAVLAHCKKILNSNENKGPKAPWMATLAFHLLTMPDIQKI